MMRTKAISIFALALAAISIASAQPITPAAPLITPAARVLTAPCDTCMPGVLNFARVSPSLWRGAQPTAQGFRALEAAGIKTIVNLRHDHDDLPLLAGAKLKYLWLPARTWNPEQPAIVLFLKTVADTANWPVFVHCAQGRDRTGYCVASYRIVVQGWPADEAVSEMNDFHFNKIWFRNPGFLRKLDTADIRRRMRLAP